MFLLERKPFEFIEILDYILGFN